MEPITVSVDQAAKMLNLGRNRVYDLIQENKVESFTYGRRRLITVASINQFIAASVEEGAA